MTDRLPENTPGSLPSGLPPFLLVIFGGTGDLTLRKLVPAFVRLLGGDAVAGGLTALVAVGRRPLDSDAYRELVRTSLVRHGEPEDAAGFERLRDRFHYHRLDFSAAASEAGPEGTTGPEGYTGLENALRGHERGLGPTVGRLYYLAAAPEAFEPIVAGLHAVGMLDETDGYRRLVVEKPFGSDLASARALQKSLVDRVPEERLYRIDHYLGKEMVRSLLGLRFGNRIFEPLWNGAHIDHVQISSCETDGVGTRGGYYEKSGALKDMVQSHLLQMLALVAMEPPASFSPDDIRDAKVAALRSATAEPLEDGGCAVLGQYAAGEVEGASVPGYREEALVAPDSDTETFAALKVRIATPRWEGVPFYLRAGKRMDRKGTWILVQFRDPVAKPLYAELATVGADRLAVLVQPEEGFFFEVNTMAAGQGFEIERVRMDYCRSCRIGYGTPLAYERLLADAAAGNPSLFVRWDELETAWSFVESVFVSCRNGACGPAPYAAGSAGPAAARRLVEADGRTWWAPEG
jgi:glucose-6-phosphate 1-dehydrogenase